MSTKKAAKKPANNKLTQPGDFTIKNVIFADPINGSVPNSTPPISFKRIPIGYKNDDGSEGDLIMAVPECFSFGVSENLSQETKQVQGWSLSLVLADREKAREDQLLFVDQFNKLVDHCKKHLIKVKEEVEQYDLTLNDLKKFNPIYQKKEKGKVVEGSPPVLYPKLIHSKKNNKIHSLFFDPDDMPLDPMELKGKYGNAIAAIKIESIFIGAKIALQVKLYEVTYRTTESGVTSVMPRRKDAGKLVSSSATAASADDEEVVVEDDEKPVKLKKSATKKKVKEDDEGSIHGSEGQPEEADEKPVRKILKKVKAKKAD